MSGVMAQPWVIEIVEDFEFAIIVLKVIETSVGRVFVKDRCWKAIYKVCGCKEGIGPEFKQEMGSMEKSEACFNNVVMATFRS